MSISKCKDGGTCGIGGYCEGCPHDADPPTRTDQAVESSDLLAQINTLKDQLGTHKNLLREWQKWADMGIEDFMPKWCSPVLNDTYDKTRTLLEG